MILTGDEIVRAYHSIFLDLEGTLYTRDGPVAGAVDAVAALRSDGCRLRFLTNTDSQGTAALHAGLVKRGFDIEPDELFTPVVAAAVALGGLSDARVLVLASDAVRDELSQRLTLVGPDDGATHVVVGDIRKSLSYELLNGAFAAVHAGARLVALQKGRYFISGGGVHLDTGAVVAALEYAADVEALVVGKPSEAFVSLALESFAEQPSPAQTWVVGDDRTTDIPMGLAAGLHTVQVRTGKYERQADVLGLPDPEFVIDSVADLPALLRTVERDQTG